jgi:hypothetical protein
MNPFIRQEKMGKRVAREPNIFDYLAKKFVCEGYESHLVDKKRHRE